MNDYYMTMCDIESEEKTRMGQIALEEYYEAQEKPKQFSDNDDWLIYPKKDPDAWLKPRYDEF
jgi:beta-glucosidase/6-phospho-beta-glucosidase/beta-galactosidase